MGDNHSYINTWATGLFWWVVMWIFILLTTPWDLQIKRYSHRSIILLICLKQFHNFFLKQGHEYSRLPSNSIYSSRQPWTTEWTCAFFYVVLGNQIWGYMHTSWALYQLGCSPIPVHNYLLRLDSQQNLWKQRFF